MAEGTKQTTHLYYWFQITSVFVDDFSDTFLRHVCVVYVLKKLEILKCSHPEKNLLSLGVLMLMMVTQQEGY